MYIFGSVLTVISYSHPNQRTIVDIPILTFALAAALKGRKCFLEVAVIAEQPLILAEKKQS